jgi:hypothetical protein
VSTTVDSSITHQASRITYYALVVRAISLGSFAIVFLMIMCSFIITRYERYSQHNLIAACAALDWLPTAQCSGGSAKR